LNGQPGGISYDGEGRVVNVFVLDIADGLVQTVRSIVNPDKLRHLGPVSDVALRRGVPGGSTPRG
jgi:RNA polymerase sigma-70 factor (ECF subfamily)